MMVRPLTVRRRVNLLAVIPLLAVALLVVPLFTAQFAQAQQAGASAQEAQTAQQVAALIEQLQQLRLLSVAYLSDPSVTPNSLTLQAVVVQEQRSGVVA